MDVQDYKDNLMLLRSLAGTTRNKLYAEWDKVLETKDLHSKDGELALKMMGRISDDFRILIGRICVLEEKLVDIEMVQDLVNGLEDC